MCRQTKCDKTKCDGSQGREIDWLTSTIYSEARSCELNLPNHSPSIRHLLGEACPEKVVTIAFLISLKCLCTQTLDFINYI